MLHNVIKANLSKKQQFCHLIKNLHSYGALLKINNLNVSNVRQNIVIQFKPL